MDYKQKKVIVKNTRMSRAIPRNTKPSPFKDIRAGRHDMSEDPDMTRVGLRIAQSNSNSRTRRKPSMPVMPWDEKK